MVLGAMAKRHALSSMRSSALFALLALLGGVAWPQTGGCRTPTPDAHQALAEGEMYCVIPHHIADDLRFELMAFCTTFSNEIGAKAHVQAAFPVGQIATLQPDRPVHVLIVIGQTRDGLSIGFAGGRAAEWNGTAVPNVIMLHHSISDAGVNARTLAPLVHALRTLVEATGLALRLQRKTP